MTAVTTSGIHCCIKRDQSNMAWRCGIIPSYGSQAEQALWFLHFIIVTLPSSYAVPALGPLTRQSPFLPARSPPSRGERHRQIVPFSSTSQTCSKLSLVVLKASSTTAFGRPSVALPPAPLALPFAPFAPFALPLLAEAGFELDVKEVDVEPVAVVVLVVRASASERTSDRTRDRSSG